MTVFNFLYRSLRTHRAVQPCGIGLQDFEIGDKLRTLPCNHVFHRSRNSQQAEQQVALRPADELAEHPTYQPQLSAQQPHSLQLSVRTNAIRSRSVPQNIYGTPHLSRSAPWRTRSRRPEVWVALKPISTAMLPQDLNNLESPSNTTLGCVSARTPGMAMMSGASQTSQMWLAMLGPCDIHEIS